MKRFRMVSDITFSAENIDDAFEKLARHFTRLTNDEDSDLIEGGKIDVSPVTDEDVVGDADLDDGA